MWLAYLVEEIDRNGPAEPWLRELADKWRIIAGLTHIYGADAGELSDDQAERLRVIGVAARERAVAAGDIPVERLRQWQRADDLPVAGGFSRTGACVELDRVLEVADGFIRLMAGQFPPEYLDGPRFPRRDYPQAHG